MKKILTIMLLIVFLSSVATPLQASALAGPTFTVGLNVQAQRGGTVTVPITVSNNPGFAAVGFVLSFNPNDLTLTRVEPTRPELPLNTNFALSSVQGNQWISLINEQNPSDFKGNNVVIANLYFNVKSTAAIGSTSVNLAFTTAPDGIPANFNGEVLNETPIPTPGSVSIRDGSGGGASPSPSPGPGASPSPGPGTGSGGNGSGGNNGGGGNNGSGSGNNNSGGGASPSPSPGTSPSPSPSPGTGIGGIKVITDFGTWTGSGTSAAKLDAEPSEFVRLKLGDNIVSETHYTVTTGSTVITLAEAYIKTLADGTYKYRAEFTNNRYADLTLIVSSTFGNVPQTSVIDFTGSVVIMWASIFLTVFLGVYLYFHIKEKRRGKIFDVLRHYK